MLDFELLLLIGLKVLFALLMIGAVMTMAGYSVLAERKVSAWMQGRVGPNRTVLPIIGSIPILGPFLQGLGIFQPLADGLKFLFKEEIVPGHVNKIYYYRFDCVRFSLLYFIRKFLNILFSEIINYYS